MNRVVKMMVPLSRFLLVAGVTIAVMSLFFPGGVSIGLNVSPGEIEGSYFQVNDDLYLHAFSELDNHSFSLYVLNHEDVILTLETGDINDTHPVLAIENVTQYEGMVHFPSRGLYGILMTHPYNETINLYCWALTLPSRSVLSAGMVIATPMAAIQLGVLLVERGYVGRKSERTPNE
jgi:hypothetical protein